MTPPTVFFYVQHLWGVGHVYRATRVAKGLAQTGLPVHLVWGGTRLSGFDFSGISVHYLPAVRTADVSFSELIHADGTEFTNSDKQSRKNQLLSLFDEVRPDILITEAFPFGRRQMLFELLPLLEKAKTSEWKPMITASIRDIMQEGRKEKRVRESSKLVKDFYDLILVHGDENLVRIEETLQGAEAFLEKVQYTGLVTPEPVILKTDPLYQCDVLVSVGGGAFGQELTRIALNAMKYSKHFPSNWLVTAGSELFEEDFRMLQNDCPDGMRVIRNIPDLAAAMKFAKVSVSHAGYNTMGDVLRAGCRSVLYPYIGQKETEQLKRARLMEQKGIATIIEPGQLSAKNLAARIDQTSRKQPADVALNLNGSASTALKLVAAFENFKKQSVD